MKDAGITQQSAADALHMSQSAFSRRYLGRVEFRASELQDLANLLGVTVADLVGADETSTPPASVAG
ncbi:helix-turn-helix DNA binding protein [Gordonia phage Hedwig]|uniref:Helix-turn-helix DNA binding protein n=1 Tax=Gordonia phage Hedwig TaxID=1887648 RepID=A0A1C9EHV0_9CAUD|nr:helix-turn-helix DNA binding protein [Gordonia phage Hedwig]AON97337.1 helix-turn-helix DNA binding protein [Gordonia phage Hedwig]